MIPLAWNWLRKNVSLVLLLSAMACLAWALGEVIRGATWSLLMPVSLSAVLCSWGLGISRLTPKQAWASLTALGISGVFIYVGGLVRPLGRLSLSILSIIPQIFEWITTRTPINPEAIIVTWTQLINHLASLFTRLWDWWLALFAGRASVDPLAAGLVWSLLLWLVSGWAGWQLRRNRQALQALAPGVVVLAFVLDYTRGEVGLLVVFLAILLALVGLATNERRHVGWQLRKVEYAESIRLDTLVTVGAVTIALVLSAAGAPSLSWRDLLDKLRGKDQAAVERAAESLGLEQRPNVANDPLYRSGGLPRSHLLSTPPELLQDVVLTVSTGELPPIPSTALNTGPETLLDINPNRYYWRSVTYDIYSGLGWGSSAAEERSLPPNTALLEFPQGYRPVTQQIKRVQESGTTLYWTGVLAQADEKIEIAWRTRPPSEPDPAQNGDMLGALTNPDEYTVVSFVPQFNADQLRAAGGEYPPQIAGRYLQLPDTIPERVLALARELTEAAPTPYDRATAIESYLRTFPYTLEVEPPPPGRDVVDYFLFTAQQGYCDYYATSMVVLARAAGLPARMVIGYASGDYNAPTAEYIVRQEHAHSWVEVYFSGLGWVEFEPTAGQPAIDRGGDENASTPPSNLPGGLSAFSWLKSQWRVLVSSLGGQLLIVGMGLVLLFTLWQVGEVGFLHLIPSRWAVVSIYSRLEKVSARLLPDLPDGHTPHQLGIDLIHRLAGWQNRLLVKVFSPAEVEIERVVNLYAGQVFSAHSPTRRQISQGVLTWMRLRWRLWVANRLVRYLTTRPRI